MKNIAKSLGIAACGLVTSILTALVVAVVSNMTGFNVFTFSLWVFVPIGAILVGLAAASGYYFGSLYFHKRADLFLLLQMVAIAGLTQLLIYYMEYSTLVLEDGRRVSDYFPFFQYLDISLTSAHYSVGRTMRDVGEVGSFGYWLAALQFVGFMFGGLVVYGELRSKPVCQICNLYLRPLSKREKIFPDADSTSSYYDVLFQHPIDSPEFAALIRLEAKCKAQKGALSVTTILLGCPTCKAQLLEENVRVNNGSEWKDISKLKRRVAIPDGVDLLSVFRP